MSIAGMVGVDEALAALHEQAALYGVQAGAGAGAAQEVEKAVEEGVVRATPPGVAALIQLFYAHQEGEEGGIVEGAPAAAFREVEGTQALWMLAGKYHELHSEDPDYDKENPTAGEEGFKKALGTPAAEEVIRRVWMALPFFYIARLQEIIDQCDTAYHFRDKNVLLVVSLALRTTVFSKEDWRYSVDPTSKEDIQGMCKRALDRYEIRVPELSLEGVNQAIVDISSVKRGWLRV